MEINIQRAEEAMKKGKSMKLMQSVTHINKLQMFALKNKNSDVIKFRNKMLRVLCKSVYFKNKTITNSHSLKNY